MEYKYNRPEKKFSVNLKNLPPLDPSIVANHHQVKQEIPTTVYVPKFERPIPKVKEEPFQVGEAEAPPRKAASFTDTTVKKESLKVKEEKKEEDDFFCAIKFVDPSSTKRTKTSNRVENERPKAPEIEKAKANEGPLNRTAKLLLHEICVANKWKTPVFVCCKEEGPGHLKLFTFKVIIEMGEGSDMLESFGTPQSKKKIAAERAAEGAIWYLKYLGYFPIKKYRHQKAINFQS